MAAIELIATATFGLEAVVAHELKQLGYTDLKVENGGVTFTADETDICRTNLWLRSADRVLVKLGSFEALSFEELFEKTKALPWPDWIPVNANFPVQGKSIKSKLFSVPDCQAIVKKAIVEKMKQKYKRQWFEEDGPRYTIQVALLKDIATLTLDTSGVGLHKRGYRKLSGDAPLKETLASAMVGLAHWFPDRLLMDPFCGTGTIPIEAALMGLNIAPGINREFAAEEWHRVPGHLWRQVREEAKAKQDTESQLKIIATDIDAEAISMARYHAKMAGVEKHIHFQQLPLSKVQTKQKYGYIICNPPYGERLSEAKEVEKLYSEMGSVFGAMDTWSASIITSYKGFEQVYGRRADKRRKLYNGRIECQYYQYIGPRPPRRNREQGQEQELAQEETSAE